MCERTRKRNKRSIPLFEINSLIRGQFPHSRSNAISRILKALKSELKARIWNEPPWEKNSFVVEEPSFSQQIPPSPWSFTTTPSDPQHSQICQRLPNSSPNRFVHFQSTSNDSQMKASPSNPIHHTTSQPLPAPTPSKPHPTQPTPSSPPIKSQPQTRPVGYRIWF